MAASSDATDAEAPFDDVVRGIFAVEEGDEVIVETKYNAWKTPMDVIDVDHVEWEAADGGSWPSRTVVVKGGYGTEYQVTVSDPDEKAILRTADGTHRGELERFEIGEAVVNDSSDEPTPSEVFDHESKRLGMADRIDLDRLLETAESAHSVWEVQRDLREPRNRVRTMLASLGLRLRQGAFPPADLQDRVATIRDGELPDDARGKGGGGGD